MSVAISRVAQAIVLMLVLSLLVATPANAGATSPVDGDPATTERIDPLLPIDFAIAVSRARFADAEAESVTISRDDAFADSLAGSPLTDDGPLLFTRTDVLPDTTAAEIQRVLPDGGGVYILGGVNAVGQAVEDAVVAAGYQVVRLAGPSRVETALVVASEVRTRFGDSGQVAVARGFSPANNPTAAWADSVTAGTWAVQGQHPIVISPTETLPDSVSAWLRDDAPDQTVLLGGEFALSAAVEDAVPNPRRVAGIDRAETAAEIATELLDFEPSGERTVVVFNPYEEFGWTRGLSAAALAQDLGAPLLAVNLAGIPPATAPLVTAGGDDPEVEVLVAAPISEVDAQLVAEMDELDGGPAAPTPGETGVGRIVSIDNDGNPTGDSTSADLGTDGSVVTYTSLNDTFERDVFARDIAAESNDALPGTPEPGDQGLLSAQAISGDSQRVVSASVGSERSELMVYDLAADEPISITNLEDDLGEDDAPNISVISGDGEWIAFAIGGAIYRQRADGTDRERVLARPVESFGAISSLWLSQDGSLVAFLTVREAFSGSKLEQVFTLDIEAETNPMLVSASSDGDPANQQVRELTMSADGNTIAFTSAATNLTEDVLHEDGTAHLYVHVVSTGDTRLVDRNPDGDPADLGVVSGATGQFGVSLTDDGGVVAFVTVDGPLTEAETDATDPTLVTVDLLTDSSQVEARPAVDAGISFPSISGDGSRIVYDLSSATSVETQVYAVDRR